MSISCCDLATRVLYRFSVLFFSYLWPQAITQRVKGVAVVFGVAENQVMQRR
ncbi:hypothetical protein [Vibrio algarum]|uniref:DUF3265 domain-containing protein n=1 Tax=Vibrio algarum TaxID=3020714 RepID=A0ABT4YVG4_9VIBR|nr:hypothetical protein [Vibrio sp. KJ40-1]MDB1125009.1 hypothetical protein [Vibrio sp. KJ40-1]